MQIQTSKKFGSFDVGDFVKLNFFNTFFIELDIIFPRNISSEFFFTEWLLGNPEANVKKEGD